MFAESSRQWLVVPIEKFNFEIQSDGNVAVNIRNSKIPLWESKSDGVGFRLAITSGNFVLFDPNNNTVWEASTGLKDTDQFFVNIFLNIRVQNSDGDVIWTSNPSESKCFRFSYFIVFIVFTYL